MQTSAVICRKSQSKFRVKNKKSPGRRYFLFSTVHCKVHRFPLFSFPVPLVVFYIRTHTRTLPPCTDNVWGLKSAISAFYCFRLRVSASWLVPSWQSCAERPVPAHWRPSWPARLCFPLGAIALQLFVCFIQARFQPAFFGVQGFDLFFSHITVCEKMSQFHLFSAAFAASCSSISVLSRKSSFKNSMCILLFSQM